jgi:hypothetical protein
MQKKYFTFIDYRTKSEVIIKRTEVIRMAKKSGAITFLESFISDMDSLCSEQPEFHFLSTGLNINFPYSKN